MHLEQVNAMIQQEKLKQLKLENTLLGIQIWANTPESANADIKIRDMRDAALDSLKPE